MELKLSIQSVYVLPEFETFYEKLEREQLAVAEMMGQQDGQVNKPTSPRHYNIQQVSSIKAVIQKALDYNYSLFKPVSTIAVTKELRNTGTENILLLEKEKNAKEKKLLFLKHEQINVRGAFNFLSSKLRIIIPALFGISEGVLVFSILQTASFPGVVKFFLSIVIALASAFGLNLGANYICKATNTKVKKERFAIVIAIAFAVAAGLGIWRAGLYEASANINSQIDLSSHPADATFSSLPFILISFISFIVALSFEIKHWLNDEQKAKLKKYEQLMTESKEIGLERENIVKEIKDIKAAVSTASGDVLRQQEYALANEYRLISLAQQIKNHYESTNIENRSDNSCPAFFGESITCDFKLYFADIFNNVKQKR
jgi:hypothetical protein